MVAEVPGEARDRPQGDAQLNHLRVGEDKDEGVLKGPLLPPLDSSQMCFEYLADN